MQFRLDRFITSPESIKIFVRVGHEANKIKQKKVSPHALFVTANNLVNGGFSKRMIEGHTVLVAGDDSGSLENGTSDPGENAVGAGGDDTGA